MGTPETAREQYRPCPDRILNRIGGMFSLGFVGGSAYHFIKGIYNSPAGVCLSGGVEAVRMNAPEVGARFAVWGALSSTFKSALVYARQKEDRWNSILAPTATVGVLEMMRGRGLAASAGTAAVGGVLFSLIEGAQIGFLKAKNALQNEPSTSQIFVQSVPESSSTSEAGSGSRFGGVFGKLRFSSAVPV